MAGLSNADPRHRLTVDAPSPPIPKDLQGSDSSMPLSPQWLLPKLGDEKIMPATGDPHIFVGKRSDSLKAVGNAEDLDLGEKKKDVFRPAFYGLENGRRDRWLDEEREASSAIRRDRWRDGEKDLNDSRKVERWSDTSKYPGESLRVPSDRWADSGNRDIAYEQRRESKWNTRWGPDDKESENWREKWSSRDGKGSPHLTTPGKEINSQDKDGNRDGESRFWRSSPSLYRAKGDSAPYLPSTLNKQMPIPGYGKGQGDNGQSVFPVGRGRVSLNSSSVTSGPFRQFALGTGSEMSNISDRDPFVLRYSRMKLLDIYRTMDLKVCRTSFEGFVEVPTLTQVEPLEPLSLTAPIAEESAILKAIDKGDIVSSGIPQALKDGSIGKSSIDLGMSSLNKSDVAAVMSDHRDDSTNNGKKEHSGYVGCTSYEKNAHGSDSKMAVSPSFHQSLDDKLIAEELKSRASPNRAYHTGHREVSRLETVMPWRSPSVAKQPPRLSSDLQEFSVSGSVSFDIGGVHIQNDVGIEQGSRDISSSYFSDVSQRQNAYSLHAETRIDPLTKRQPSVLVEQDREGIVHGQDDKFIHRAKLIGKHQPYPSPDDLILCYKDPQGQIQGPFSGNNLIEWFDAGYFGIDLQVRLANAPLDAPFSLLGDVIPQLRTRVRPPPGFGAARLSDIVEVSNRGNFGGSGNVHTSLALFDSKGFGNESKVEAENRFLESLMANRISNAHSESYSMAEGMHGCHGFIGVGPSLGSENRSDMNFLGQKLSIGQQSSLPASSWPSREPLSILPNTNIVGESPTPQSKCLPQVGLHNMPLSPQNLDLLSILRSTAEKAPLPPSNSALPSWQNFLEVQAQKNIRGDMGVIKDKIELHHSQQNINNQIGFGTPPQRLQPQIQPPLSKFTQLGGLSAGIVSPENVVASEFSQDPHMLNILRQQYMLFQQLHSQGPTHLDPGEFLLLMQRQREEQQHQQQNLLPHIFSGLQPHQYFNEPSLNRVNTSAPVENASLVSPVLPQMNEMLQSKHQIQVLESNDSHVTCFNSSNLHEVQDAKVTVMTEQLPLELQDEGCNESSDAKQMVLVGDTLEPAKFGYVHEASFLERHMAKATALVSQITSETTEMVGATANAVNTLFLAEKDVGNYTSAESIPVTIDDGRISPPKQAHKETSELKGVGDAELPEVKKVSEKKSRKQKKSQLRAVSEHGKGSSKVAPVQHSQQDLKAVVGENVVVKAEHLYDSRLETAGQSSTCSISESLDSGCAGLSSKICASRQVGQGKAQEEEFKSLVSNLQISSNHRTWKPAAGQKAKSLLEIQLEQRRAEVSSMPLDTSITMNLPTNVSSTLLATGPVNSEQKVLGDCVQVASTLSVSENPWNSKNRKSQLHYVSAEEVLANASGAKDVIVGEERGTASSPLPPLVSQVEMAFDEDDFVVAKDTRKNRKKAAKYKGVALKSSTPFTLAELPVSARTTEKEKATNQTQKETELLPGPPAAPSLGDFFWKGDQPSSVPAPAWSTDPVKHQKPTSLRDILKEQEKRTKAVPQQSQVPIPSQVMPSRGSVGSSSSWLVSGASPSKASLSINSKSTFPVQSGSLALGQAKTGTEDDLFWGPLDEAEKGNRPGFPSLAKSSGSIGKGALVKGAYGEASTRKPSGNTPADHVVTPSPSISSSLSKGKKDAVSKHSEAADFQDWCEEEWLRLTGTNDTSFLEFCLKQSTSEAEALLRENLGSLDRNHEFIDKFLSYKEFLSPEVIEITFRGQRISNKANGEGQSQSSHGIGLFRDVDGETDNNGVNGSSRGKKKGKKGKKLSPAVLGFNVVSNRIMMGEIQNIED